MIWEIKDPECSLDQFKGLEITEVLYDFNGPKIFVSSSGKLQYLWYQSAENMRTGQQRFLVVPTDNGTLDLLKSGAKSVYEALKQPWLWAIDTDLNDDVIAGWRVHLDDVPIQSKPKKEVLLWPELEPLISYRLIGDGLREGTIPASIASRALERPINALKRLLEINNAPSQGRPEEAFRKTYDLPAQRFAFNSFEVSFSVPRHISDPKESYSNIYEIGAESLSRSLTWLNAGNSESELDIASLEVLKELVPPAHGLIEKVELRGRLILDKGVVTLTREHRTIVTTTISKSKGKNRELIKTEGRIGELDKDQLTFILRNLSGNSDEIKCSFSEEQFDDVYDAFHKDLRVTLLGKLHTTRSVIEVLAIESAGID